MPIKRDYQPYSPSAVTRALQATTDGNSIRGASRMYGVPESTLRFRLASTRGAANPGHPAYFSESEERQLADHCIQMASLGYGYTRWQVIEIAENMATLTGRSVSPTKHWFYGFMKRFADLKMINPKKREKCRADSVSVEVVSSYYENLEKVLNSAGLLNNPTGIWNVDETGLTLDHTPPKVLGKARQDPVCITASKSATTTVIAAGNAIGEILPPYIVYKGKRLTEELTSGGIKGTKYNTSETGWSNSITFMDWFSNHFLQHVPTRPCILLYDGHATHVTADIIKKARESNVYLFVLPAHTSHLLQPLDVSAFGPFKKAFSSECHKFVHENPNRVITRNCLPMLIASAYRSSMTVNNIMAAFRKTGIFPFNPDVVLSQLNICPTVSSTAKPSNRKERKDTRVVRVLLSEKVQKIENANAEKKVIVRKSVIPRQGAAITEDQFFEEAMKRNNKPPTKSSESITVQKKLGDKENELNPGKSGKGHLTNSHRGKGPAKSKKRKIELSEDFNDDDDNTDELFVVDNVPCCICGERYAPTAPKGDLVIFDWGQCDVCSGWVHLKYCSKVRSLAPSDPFLCSKCQ